MKTLNRILQEGAMPGAEEAAKMGLQHVGFGMYRNPETGKVTHMVKNGELVPVAKSQDKMEQSQELMGTDGVEPQDKEGKIQGHVKQSFKLKNKVNSEIDDHFEDQDKDIAKQVKSLLKAQAKNLGGDLLEVISSNKCQRAAIGEYLSSGHKSINSFIAKGNILPFDSSKVLCAPIGSDIKDADIAQNMSNLIRTIEKLIEKNEVMETIVAYRGLSAFNSEEMHSYFEDGNDVINLQCFVSFAINTDTALSHSEGDEIVLSIPVGTKALFIQDLYENEETELEIILQRGTKIKITTVDEHLEDRKVFFATVISQ